MFLKFKLSIPDSLDRILVWPLLKYRKYKHGYPFRLIPLNEGQYTTVDPANFYRLNKYDWFCFGKDDNLYAARMVRLKSGRVKFLLMHRQIFFSERSADLAVVSEGKNFKEILLRGAVRGTGSEAAGRGACPLFSLFISILNKFSSLSFSPRLRRGLILHKLEWPGDVLPFFPRSHLFDFSPSEIYKSVVDHINTSSLDNRLANLRPATRSQNSCNSRRDKSNTYSKFRGVSFSKRKQKWFSAIRIIGKKKWLGYFDNEIDAARAYDMAAKKYHKDFAWLNFPEATSSS